MGSEGETRRDVLVLGALGVNWALAGCLRATSAGNRSTGESPTGSSRGSERFDDSTPTPSSADESAADAPSSTDGPATDAPTDLPLGDGLDFETSYHQTLERVLDGGIGGESAGYLHATTMTTEAETDRFELTALDEGTAAFVEETSFPGEMLLVVQRHLPSINLELDLAWARIEDGILDARVETVHEYILDAATNATLVARLHLDGRPVPEGGTATFVDREGGTTEVPIE